MFSGGLLRWSEFRSVLKLGMGIFLLAILVISGRMMFLSHHYVTEARTAVQQGKSEEALHSYNQSIRNYFPANPFVERALQEVEEIIEKYRAEGNRIEEERALRDLRASLLSIRSFFQPYPETLHDIEARLQQGMNEEHARND